MVTLGYAKNLLPAAFVPAEPAGSEAARLRATIVSGGQLQGMEAAREVIQSGFTGVECRPCSTP